MLFPIKHENMTARRWPVITLGLILLNVLVFLCTHNTMDRQDASLSPVEMHLLVLAARHPELTIPTEAQRFVSAVQAKDPTDWAAIQSPDSPIIDDWDTRMRGVDDPEQLQAEMDSLATEYSKLVGSSITQHYAFIPAHPKAIAYISSTFLHAGWMHLIGNMWFLWLAGFVLEDVWGRPLYLIFYLVAGIAATQLDAWANTGSIAPNVRSFRSYRRSDGGVLGALPKIENQAAVV